MQTTWPSAAARKAAESTTLRILPPLSLKAVRQPRQIDVLTQGQTGWQTALPDAQPVISCVWQRKIDHEVHAPDKGFIQVVAQVGRQDHHPFIFFHLLQQVSHLDIGIAVVCIPHLRAPAKKGVRFIEEQNGIGCLRLNRRYG